MKKLPVLLAIVFLGLVQSKGAYAADQEAGARISELARSKYWLRLLHFTPSWPFGTRRSELDGPEFFFSPVGKSDPEAELRATIQAFSQDIKVGRLKQHPQCAFPERYRFLKQELGLATKDVQCEKLGEFIAKFNAKSATLVFSSAFPNNPGSMFGHTFLRINSAADRKSDLLDHGISFAAVVPPDDGGLVFAVLGLAGGYMGQFSTMPYYAKVNEYTNNESRDLWEYDLALNPEQTRRMLLHAWELETNSWFNYFFFDENCSYQLLALLEVARVDWDLSSFAIYVIPGETVKRVTAVPGAVTGVKFRPSLRKKMLQKFYALDKKQRDVFHDVIGGRVEAGSVGDRGVLETASAYFYYEKQKADGKLSDANSARLKSVLTRRSELAGPPEPEFTSRLGPIEEDTRPDLGHGTYRLGVAAGVRNGGRVFQELQFKFAFHDLLNKDLGYTRNSQIDFPGAVVRFNPGTPDGGDEVTVEQAQILAITSLFPLVFIEKKASWKFNADYYSPKDFGCVTCHAFRTEAGLGGTFDLFSPKHIFYALGLFDLEGGESFRMGFRWGPRLQTGFIASFLENYKTHLQFNLNSDLGQPDRPKHYIQIEWGHSLALSQSWEIRMIGQFLKGYREGKLGLNFYF